MFTFPREHVPQDTAFLTDSEDDVFAGAANHDLYDFPIEITHSAEAFAYDYDIAAEPAQPNGALFPSSYASDAGSAVAAPPPGTAVPGAWGRQGWGGKRGMPSTRRSLAAAPDSQVQGGGTGGGGRDIAAAFSSAHAQERASAVPPTRGGSRNATASAGITASGGYSSDSAADYSDFPEDDVRQAASSPPSSAERTLRPVARAGRVDAGGSCRAAGGMDKQAAAASATAMPLYPGIHPLHGPIAMPIPMSPATDPGCPPSAGLNRQSTREHLLATAALDSDGSDGFHPPRRAATAMDHAPLVVSWQAATGDRDAMGDEAAISGHRSDDSMEDGGGGDSGDSSAVTTDGSARSRHDNGRALRRRMRSRGGGSDGDEDKDERAGRSRGQGYASNGLLVSEAQNVADSSLLSRPDRSRGPVSPLRARAEGNAPPSTAMSAPLRPAVAAAPIPETAVAPTRGASPASSPRTAARAAASSMPLLSPPGSVDTNIGAANTPAAREPGTQRWDASPAASAAVLRNATANDAARTAVSHAVANSARLGRMRSAGTARAGTNGSVLGTASARRPASTGGGMCCLLWAQPWRGHSLCLVAQVPPARPRRNPPRPTPRRAPRGR